MSTVQCVSDNASLSTRAISPIQVTTRSTGLTHSLPIVVTTYHPPGHTSTKMNSSATKTCKTSLTASMLCQVCRFHMGCIVIIVIWCLIMSCIGLRDMIANKNCG